MSGITQLYKKKKRVGIPRALLFYKFEAMWTTFFERLGAEVVISPSTTKQMKADGILSTLDDDCYSSKLFYGHVHALKDKVDYLFVPRFASRKKREVGCPKFIALADVLKATIEDLPPIIGPYYSTSRENHGIFRLLKIVFQIGFLFTKNPFRILKATLKALQADKEYLKNLIISEEDLIKWERSELSLNDPPIIPDDEDILKIAIVSHPYVVNDEFACLEIRAKLRDLGADIITAQQMPRSLISRQIARLSYDDYGLKIKDINNITKEEKKKYYLGENDYLYFEFEHELVGTVMHYLENKKIDGILMLVNFICGPVSVSLEYVKLFAKRIGSRTPLMVITLDAHTGQAGFQTRLEAFTDILRLKKQKGEGILPRIMEDAPMIFV
ncbi:MAG TPA: acyl-CoA dehydratase activase-related protein [Candidatus Bathyarchaeia archaeon]|nr:acyl-CoA dehydratase activase-related protein [Candidatus Bathyarchaeia archaeon]